MIVRQCGIVGLKRPYHRRRHHHYHPHYCPHRHPRRPHPRLHPAILLVVSFVALLHPVRIHHRLFLPRCHLRQYLRPSRPHLSPVLLMMISISAPTTSPPHPSLDPVMSKIPMPQVSRVLPPQFNLKARMPRRLGASVSLRTLPPPHLLLPLLPSLPRVSAL